MALLKTDFMNAAVYLKLNEVILNVLKNFNIIPKVEKESVPKNEKSKRKCSHSFGATNYNTLGANYSFLNPV